MKLTISLAQMAFTFGEPQENFQRVRLWPEKAKGAGADLLLFPELWASGYDLENSEEYATPLGEGGFKVMSLLAEEHGLIIGGSLLEQHQGKVYNTFTLYGRDGKLIDHYRKIHLFQLLDEPTWLTAGQEMVLTETPWGKVGLSTCYDLRYPEMYRAYALAGAKLILVVAEWPQSRIEHWRTLLQARAIENQVYLAAVNKVGRSQGAVLGGSSAIIDPWGEVLVEGGLEQTLLTGEVDLRAVDRVRRRIPILEDRSPAAYGRMRGNGG